MPDNAISKEFMDALNNYHNPDTVFKMAKTDFEKAVAIEFFLITKRLDIQSTKMKHLDWLVKGIFGVTLISVLAELVPKFFGA